MTKLSTVANLLKNLAWVFAVLILILFLLFLIFFSFSVRKEKSVINPITQPVFESTITKINQLNTQELALPKDIPKTLPVFQIDASNNLLNIASTLAQKLGFKESPVKVTDINLGEGLIYSKKGSALGVFRNEISYQRITSAVLKGAFKDIDNLKKEALGFFSGLGLVGNFSEEPKVSYYRLVDEFSIQTHDLNEANLVKINFHYEVEGHEVISARREVSATFDKEGNLTKAVYYSFNAGQAVNNYPIISSQEALQVLTTGRGSLIKVSPQNELSPLPKALGQVNIKKTYLGYYLPSEDQGLIQPVWVFAGEGPIDDQRIEVVYAVPAISERFLITP